LPEAILRDEFATDRAAALDGQRAALEAAAANAQSEALFASEAAAAAAEVRRCKLTPY
jgi:hypothetical protein